MKIITLVKMSALLLPLTLFKCGDSGIKHQLSYQQPSANDEEFLSFINSLPFIYSSNNSFEDVLNHWEEYAALNPDETSFFQSSFEGRTHQHPSMTIGIESNDPQFINSLKTPAIKATRTTGITVAACSDTDQQIIMSDLNLDIYDEENALIFLEHLKSIGAFNRLKSVENSYVYSREFTIGFAISLNSPDPQVGEARKFWPQIFWYNDENTGEFNSLQFSGRVLYECAE